MDAFDQFTVVLFYALRMGLMHGPTGQDGEPGLYDWMELSGPWAGLVVGKVVAAHLTCCREMAAQV